MKNRFFFTLMLGMLALGLHAQDMSQVKVLEDITSKLTNADFSADAPMESLICTYDYDMANNGTTFYGQIGRAHV